MNSKQAKTLQAIMCWPASGHINWQDIEALLLALGASLVEGAGSRVRFTCGNAVFTAHRPHPGKEALPYQIRDARNFITAIREKQ